jgi:protein phosphatase
MMTTRTAHHATALAYEAATVSRVGKARAVNEDVVDVRVRNRPDGIPVGYAILCDGLGGYEAGEIASRLAVRVMRKALVDAIPGLEDGPAAHTAPIPDAAYIERRLAEAVSRANHRIYRFSRENEEASFSHSGTAMTLAALLGEQAVIGHIGNSRAYRYRAGDLMQITTDHTIVAELVAAGVVSARKGRGHPQLNPNSAGALDRLARAIDRVREAIGSRDARAFGALMREGEQKTPIP